MNQEKKRSFLLVGLGAIGQQHLHNLVALGIRDISIYSENYNTFPEEKLSQYTIEPDLEQAINKKPTAIIIATPTAFHVDTALQGAKKGCHLFIEKPLSHNNEGIHELKQLAQKHNIIVQMGFQFRFHPVFQKIKEWIDQGMIGKIVSMHAHWGESLPCRAQWKTHKEGLNTIEDPSGGTIVTLCHPFDYLRWLGGDIKHIYAITDSLSKLKIETEDTALVALQFASGAIGSIYLDYIEQPPTHNLLIIGQKGKIRWDDAESCATLHMDNQFTQTVWPPMGFQYNTLFLNELACFINCIKEGTFPDCNLDAGIQALKIAMAVKYSTLEKREIHLLEGNIA